MGKHPQEYSPFVAAVLTYTLIFLPFCLAAALYRELRAMLSVQKLLLVANVYNAIYCACLVILNVVTGNEPMSSLQASNEADYIILQFLKGETASHTTPFAWCTPFLKDFSRRHSSPAFPFQRTLDR